MLWWTYNCTCATAHALVRFFPNTYVRPNRRFALTTRCRARSSPAGIIAAAAIAPPGSSIAPCAAPVLPRLSRLSLCEWMIHGRQVQLSYRSCLAYTCRSAWYVLYAHAGVHGALFVIPRGTLLITTRANNFRLQSVTIFFYDGAALEPMRRSALRVRTSSKRWPTVIFAQLYSVICFWRIYLTWVLVFY